MASVPDRGDLTLWLQDLLTQHGLLVGLLQAPTDGGWNDDPGQPGNYFAEYIVINPMDSSEPTGPVSDPSGDWSFPYSLTANGIQHSQVEGQADKARRIVNEVRRVSLTLGGEAWKVMSCRISTIGGISPPDREVNPVSFTQRDVVLIRITKEIS